MVKKKSKRGWIKIIEAFVSILFLIGVVAIVIQSDNFYSKEEPILEKKQTEILTGIQMNESLRGEVLTTADYMNSTNPTFSTALKSHLSLTPINNAECYLVVCPASSECGSETSEDELYSKSVLITSTLSTYNPKKVKIFCYKI